MCKKINKVKKNNVVSQKKELLTLQQNHGSMHYVTS